MSDDLPKLVQEFFQAGRDARGYPADLGDLPEDLVRLLAGDRVKFAPAGRLAILWANAKKRLQDRGSVKFARARWLAILWANTKKRLQDRGIAEPEPPSLKLALPILEAAADENNQGDDCADYNLRRNKTDAARVLLSLKTRMLKEAPLV